MSSLNYSDTTKDLRAAFMGCFKDLGVKKRGSDELLQQLVRKEKLRQEKTGSPTQEELKVII